MAPMNFRFAAYFLATAALLSSARADVIVIANRSHAQVRFDVVDGDRPTKSFTLNARGVATLYVERAVTLRLPAKANPREFRLDVDSAYFFHDGKADHQVELEKIRLTDAAEPGRDAQKAPPAPPVAKKPDQPPAARPPTAVFTIPVKILVDDEQRAARRLWEDRLRKRIAAASQVFRQQFHIQFKVVAVGTWTSNNAVTDFDESLREFERLVDEQPAQLAIGFTSQYEMPKGFVHLGGLPRPLSSHILVPELSRQALEPEHGELLVHELGHYLGAVHSVEADSAMRTVLDNHRAAARGFSMSIDPVNSLAIALVAEQVRLHGLANLADLTPPKRQRLIDIYSTLWRTAPEDPIAAEYSALVQPAFATAETESPGSASAPEIDAPSNAKPASTVKVSLDSFVAATQHVMEAIFVAANRNATSTKASANMRAAAPVAGDELTDLYVRSAAAAAAQLPPEHRGPAFFLGLALGLDRGDRMRKYVVLGDFVQRIEPDADRRRRLAVLGHPTVGGREDLAQHFTFSAAIAAMAGTQSAESVGLAKELADSQGKSGFSFVDWCADLAGIALTKRVQSGKISLAALAHRFRTANHLPDVSGLEEGLSRTEFDRRFGSTSDPRFRQIDDDIRQRVKQLYSRD
jgi:hypothetical protein